MFASTGEIAAALRAAAISCFEGAVLALQRCFEPPLHVEEDPPLVGVVSDRAQNERVVKRVEERPEIKVDHPVVAPTTRPAAPHRVQGRPPRPVPIGVRVEQGFHLWLQAQARDALSDPIGNGGNTEGPAPAGRPASVSQPP